ncbi:DUF2663 family protein [Fictibacillus fluitans]|uniref:DUF2663 family protein n=1 Tax=Fictibacillus fluitans TaxID=3058422 RepID=A0ABT8I2U4_9BACL|nr:DUF2663 family protein [Fictibacillus sp. NE201]MDN4527354.1 DUF2663 family protein [Fictibacillus sp. NE201]
MNALNYWKVEPYISDICKVVLQTLIEKKERKDQLDKQMKRWAFYSSLMGCLSLIYLYGFKWNEAGSLRAAVASLAGDQMIWFIFVYFLLAGVQWKRIKKKCAKADEEFESIRKEIVERGDDLWPRPDMWNNRHQVMEFIKSEYNINLYYK